MKQGDPIVDERWFADDIITVVSLDGGYPADRELARKYLEIGETYTVKHTWVWPSISEVELAEFPGIKFNTVYFR